jgi:nitrite reductase/ring-hydroxylating ferredoxin subunit
LLLELAGFAMISVAGWLGGTLVIRNQIGVDHRYADAGKWKEETLHTAEKEVEVNGLRQLGVNQMKLFRVNGKRIVVGKTESGYVAFDDYCSHRGASLADGVMICGTVQCPWHGSQFDLKDGSVKAGPANKGITIYPISQTGRLTLK